MTLSTLSRLPLQAGSALATGAGRALLWGIARYSRAPLAHTSILALTVFTAMAGSNALYLQDARHPAPLFGPMPDLEIGLPEPVTPAIRQSAVTVPDIVVIDETTGSIPAAAPAPTRPVPAPIGDGEIIELQRKLTTMGLYEGKIDGVFGPKTAGAIRRFEERAGLPAKGQLTHELVEAVAKAPLVLPQAAAEPARTLAVIPVQPAPQQPIVVVAAPPAPIAVASAEVTGSIPPASVGNPAAPEDSFQPLPDPAPLQLSLQAATGPQSIIKPQRDLPDSPGEVINLAVATARNGIEAIASVIENGPQLGPIPPASIAPVTPPAPVPATQTATVPPVQQPPIQVAAVQQPMPPMPAAGETIAPPATTVAPATLAPVATVAPPATTTPAANVTEPVVAAAPAAAPAMEVPVFDVADTAPVVTAPLSGEAMTDRELVAKVQRGLSSLGFLRGEVDGVAGEATAKAVRNFEVYYNYQVTGRVTPGLVDLLIAAGAQI